jgi:hypothetical protein
MFLVYEPLLYVIAAFHVYIARIDINMLLKKKMSYKLPIELAAVLTSACDPLKA